VKRPPNRKWLLAALALLVGAASATAPRHGIGTTHHGENMMLLLKTAHGRS
jgi:hypothetical protein